MTPLDLARWRALADEAEESLHSIALLWQEMQAAMRRREPVHPNDIGNDPITVSAKAAELATALRAACDEVERLREALERIRDGAGSNTVALSDVQDERAHTWGGVYQIAVKAVGERPVHLHTTSFGHITGGAR